MARIDTSTARRKLAAVGRMEAAGALIGGAPVVEGILKANTPVDTGALRDSTGSRIQGPNRIRTAWGERAYQDPGKIEVVERRTEASRTSARQARRPLVGRVDKPLRDEARKAYRRG